MSAPDAEDPIEQVAITNGPLREAVLPALSEVYTIELLDADLAPVIGARAMLCGDERVRVSDGAGRLSFERPGARGLLAADGFRPVTFEVPRGHATLELVRDLGLDVHVHWEDTGDPVVGARIERVGLYDKTRLERLQRLLGGNLATDLEGNARVHGLHLDSETLRLRFEHALGAITWQELGVLLEDTLETPRLDVAMPRGGTGMRFRVVDAAAAPLADRKVRVTWLGNAEARTDANGRVTVPFAVRNVDPEEWNLVAVSVQLEAEDSWWWTGFHRLDSLAQETLLQVMPLRIHGRVVTDTPEAWQVTSANLHGHDSGPTPKSWPHADRLVWSDLAEDGSFALESGWQGVNAAVFLRTRGCTVPIQAESVPPDGTAITIVAQPTCRVVIELLDVSQIDAAMAVLELLQSRGPQRTGSPNPVLLARLDPLFPIQTVFVPRGTYEGRLRVGTATTTLADLDASGPELHVPIRLPRLRRVVGTVRGTLSGALERTQIRFSRRPEPPLASARCDAEGRFAVDLPDDVDLIARAEGWRYHGGGVTDPFAMQEPWTVPAGQTECDFVRREAELRVVERPWNPLLASMPPRVHIRNPDGSRGWQIAEFELHASDAPTLLLPPGNYLVVRHLGELRALSQPVTLVDGERRELVLDSHGIAALALEVHIEHDGARQIRVELRDAEGHSVWRSSYATPQKGPFRLFQPFVPGAYSASVGTYATSDEHAPPLATWSGTVDAVPGATEPAVVRLR